MAIFFAVCYRKKITIFCKGFGMNSLFISLGVLAATIARIAIGSAWFSSSLFGPLWVQASKVKPDAAKMQRAIVGETLASLLMALVMTCLMYRMGINSIASGFHFGWMAWLGFVVPTTLQAVLWADYSFVLFALNAGNNFVAMIAMGAILGLFL